MSEGQRFVPRLRFPEFREAGNWKLVPLNQLATRSKRKNRDEELERVLTNSAEFGVMDQRDYFDKDIATQGKLEGYSVVELGDYVYNPRISATAPVGPISKNLVGTGVMSPLYTVFRFNEPNNDFYRHYFRTTGWHAYLRQASSTGARHDRMAVGSEDFMAMPLPVTSEPEQQKIADCLNSLDELIVAQVRKVGAIKTHKQGLMQGLLPSAGKTQPRLRFAAFRRTGEWKTAPLSEICTIKHGYAFESEFYSSKGNYVLLTPGNFNEHGGYRDRGDGQKHYVGEIPEGYVLNEGDLLVAMTEQAAGLLGSPILVPASDRFLHNQRLGLVSGRSESPWSNSFFFHVFNTEYVRSAISANSSGAKVRHTSPGKIGEVVVSVPPSLLEQETIAVCLSSLDAMRAAEEQRLERLKTQKQGLMRHLFPATDAAAA